MKQIKKTLELTNNIFVSLKEKLIILISIDLLFLFLFGFISNAFLTKIAEYLYAIQIYLTQNASSIKSTQMLTQTTGDATLNSYASMIIFTFIIYYISIYLLYSIIQGTSWFLTYKYSKEITNSNQKNINNNNKILLFKTSLSKILLKFAIINLPLLLFYIIYKAISFIVGFDKYSSSDILRINLNSSNFLFLLIIFFYLIFYSNLFYKNTIKKSFKSITKIKNLKQYLAASIMLLLIILLNYISGISKILIIPVGIFLILPLISYTRIYLININNK